MISPETQCVCVERQITWKSWLDKGEISKGQTRYFRSCSNKNGVSVAEKRERACAREPGKSSPGYLLRWWYLKSWFQFNYKLNEHLSPLLTLSLSRRHSRSNGHDISTITSGKCISWLLSPTAYSGFCRKLYSNLIICTHIHFHAQKP